MLGRMLKLALVLCTLCWLLALVLTCVILFACAALLGASLALGLTVNALLSGALCVLFSALLCALLAGVRASSAQ